MFLFSPYFSTKEKTEGLGKAISGADETVVNFLELLIEKHRMPAIFRVRARVRRAVGGGEQAPAGEITSAVELDESTVKHVGDRISEQTGRKVELSARVEPDILGGIIVRVGNSILDASIRNRLENLASRSRAA